MRIIYRKNFKKKTRKQKVIKQQTLQRVERQIKEDFQLHNIVFKSLRASFPLLINCGVMIFHGAIGSIGTFKRPAAEDQKALFGTVV